MFSLLILSWQELRKKKKTRNSADSIQTCLELHLFHGFNSENVETLFQNARRQIANRQPRFAHRAFRLEHRTIFVKARELPRQIKQIIAQKIRTIFLRHRLQRQPKIQPDASPARSLPARLISSSAHPPLILHFLLPKDAFDPRVGVKQIGRGVALQRERHVPTENVIALAGSTSRSAYFTAPSAKMHTRNFFSLRLGKIGTLFRNNLERPRLGFVEQVTKFYRVAGARLERLAVVAENFPKADMS